MMGCVGCCPGQFVYLSFRTLRNAARVTPYPVFQLDFIPSIIVVVEVLPMDEPIAEDSNPYLFPDLSWKAKEKRLE